jgi:hypothetical protein
MSSKSVARLVAIVAVGAMSLAACGDDDSAGAPATTVPATSGPATSVPATGAPATSAGDTAPGPGDAGSPTGEAGATVTIDGEQFTLGRQVVCVSMGGAIGAQFQSSDGSLSLSVDLPPSGWETSGDGWEAPSVRFDDEREDRYLQWEAGGEVLAGMTGVPDGIAVTSYSIDGRAASGSASVVDLTSMMTGEPQTADLSFQVACD